jgi:mono/diheme cytochrome c family protein
VRGALLLAGAVALAGCESSDIDPMELQQRYRPYDPIEQFGDGRSMLRPPDGTVPRERPLDTAAVRTGQDEKGPLARVPIPVTAELLALGRARFEVSCAACHGTLGDGDSVVAAQMSLRPPPSLLDPKLRTIADGLIYRTITEGYGMMPSYAPSLSPRERWAVVAYVRALQTATTGRIDDAPPAARAKLEGEAR